MTHCLIISTPGLLHTAFAFITCALQAHTKFEGLFLVRTSVVQQILPPPKPLGIYFDVDVFLAQLNNEEETRTAIWSSPRKCDSKALVYDGKTRLQRPSAVAERMTEVAVDVERKDTNTGDRRTADRQIHGVQLGSSPDGTLGNDSRSTVAHCTSPLLRRGREVSVLFDAAQI